MYKVPTKPTNRPPKALQAKWEALLAQEGLQPLSGWYDQYSTLGGPQLIPIDAVEGFLDQLQTELSPSDGDAVRLHNLPEAVFWREAFYRANALPPKAPNRAFLIAAADSGNLEGTAKDFKQTIAWARWQWRKFLDAK